MNEGKAIAPSQDNLMRDLLGQRGISFFQKPKPDFPSVQGFVGATMVFHGDIIGMPMSRQGIASEGGEA